MASYSVKGKTAIVTGAGSGNIHYSFPTTSHIHLHRTGINFSFASLLLSKGCNVVLADLTLRPEAQALVDQYSNSPRAIFCKTDVRDWSQLDRMFAVGIKEFQDIDIVCPGAGIYDPHWSNFWHPPGTPQSHDAINADRYASLDINVTHPIRTTQLAITHFLAAQPKVSPDNPKRVVLISSIAGQLSNLHTPLYTAGKHAMNGFIRSLTALEPRFGIRVNGVAPGVIKTPLWTEAPEKLVFVDQDKDEWASAEEVAEAMLRCLEEEELVGGTILEVGKEQTRRVEALVSIFFLWVDCAMLWE
jgi:NAD(P)-dependent dehydrogenase (short-subunit alcohol dehydrogenase family)